MSFTEPSALPTWTGEPGEAVAEPVDELGRDERLDEGDGLHEVDDVLAERRVLAQDGRVVEDLGTLIINEISQLKFIKSH